MLEIKRNGLIITSNGSLDASAGSYDVPVSLTNDDTYSDYVINMYVGWRVRGVLKKRKAKTDSSGNYLIPGEAFQQNGMINISFLLEKNDKTQGFMTNALGYQVKDAPNVIIEVPPDPTWQDLVREWCAELVDGIAPIVSVSKENGVATIKITDKNETHTVTIEDGYTPQKGVDYFDGENGLNGASGYTPKKGVDYWTEQDIEGIQQYVDSEIADVKAQGVQQIPLYPEDGNTVEEQLAWLKTNGDTSKVYLLADGNLYVYSYTEKAVGGYTNVVDTADSTFQVGYRYNASGSVTTSSIEKDNCFVSNMFALKQGDILRVRGVRASTSSTATAPVYSVSRLKADGSLFTSGNANNLYLGQPLGASVTTAQQCWDAFTTLADGTIEWQYAINNAGNDMAEDSTIVNARLSGVATDGIESVIVTVNEPIVEASVQRVYEWVNSGHAFIPADYEDRIVKLEEKTSEHDVELLEIKEQLENIQIGATEEVKWFALGDSITEGYASLLNDDGTYNQFVTEAQNRWVNILAEKNGYTLTNHGIGGTGYLRNTDTKYNARQLADTLDFSQCDMVTLAYGVNDWKYAVNIGSMSDDITTGGSMVANMRYVIQKILTDNPYCKIFVITPINCRSYGDYSTNYGINYKGGTGGHLNSLGLQDIFDRIQEVCDYHGIEMIDMTHSSVVNRENIRNVLADAVHPTVECHKAIARELAKKINFK